MISCAGKALYMQLIRKMNVLYVSESHILESKTNGENLNSSMMFWNMRQKT
jgi:hypothetical protein